MLVWLCKLVEGQEGVEMQKTSPRFVGTATEQDMMPQTVFRWLGIQNGHSNGGTILPAMDTHKGGLTGLSSE